MEELQFIRAKQSRIEQMQIHLNDFCFVSFREIVCLKGKLPRNGSFLCTKLRNLIPCEFFFSQLWKKAWFDAAESIKYNRGNRVM